MKKYLFSACMFVAVFTLAASALGVLTSDSTNIGKHPNYSNQFSAFWRTSSDYAYLTDGSSTWINAPASTGTILFRAANSCSSCVSDPVSGSSMAYIDSNSNMVLGNSLTATDHIELVGTGSYLYMPFTNAYIWLSGSGSQAYKPGGGSWATTSDVRVKKNEIAFTTGLDALRKIRPVVYSYNGLGGMPDDDVRYVGVNAQDLEKVAPSMVSARRTKLRPGDTEDADVKTVDPSAFTYMLINAVQDLDRQVQELKTHCH